MSSRFCPLAAPSSVDGRSGSPFPIASTPPTTASPPSVSSSSRPSPVPYSPTFGPLPPEIDAVHLAGRLGALDTFPSPLSPSSSSVDPPRVPGRFPSSGRNQRSRLVEASGDAEDVFHFSVGNRRGETEVAVHTGPDPRPLICMQNVPSFLTPADLCGEKLAMFLETIRHIRVVGGIDGPGRYGLLLLFGSPADATQFRFHFDGRPLSTLGTDVVSVRYVQMLSVGNRAWLPIGPITFPGDSAEVGDCAICMERCGDPEAARHSVDAPHLTDSRRSSAHNHSDSSRDPDSHGAGNESGDGLHCDAGSGGPGPSGPGAVFTTLCNHTFHGRCLSQWGDSCPVCRFNQQDVTSTCFDCPFDLATDLWLCITCGNIGCGRYTEGKHALIHYRTTHHTYSMNVGSRQVWDYAGDGLVHRLLLRTDGKLAETADPQSTSKAREGGDDVYDLADAKLESKVDAICHFYSNLLESQLKEQQAYFESKVTESDAEYGRHLTDLQGRAAAAAKAIEALRREVAALTGEARRGTTVGHPDLAALREELMLQESIGESLRQEITKCRTMLEGLRARDADTPLSAEIAALEARVAVLRARLTGDDPPPTAPTAPPASAASSSSLPS